MNIKKIGIAFVLILAAISATACNKKASRPEKISEDAALEIALEHASLGLEVAVIESKELVDENEQEIYRFSFSYPKYFTFNYDINAYDGSLMNYKLTWNEALGRPDDIDYYFNVYSDEVLASVLAHAGVDKEKATIAVLKYDLVNALSLYTIEFFDTRAEYKYTVSGSYGRFMEYECKLLTHKQIDKR